MGICAGRVDLLDGEIEIRVSDKRLIELNRCLKTGEDSNGNSIKFSKRGKKQIYELNAQRLEQDQQKKDDVI